MPRRERRKCSVCDKTGHNKRTCAVFAAMQQTEPTLTPETSSDMGDDVFVLASESSDPKETTSHPTSVLVRVSHVPETSPHVVHLAETDREDQLRSIDVFRQQYQRIDRGDRVDFASLIRAQKRRREVQYSQAPAFSVDAASVPETITPFVPIVRTPVRTEDISVNNTSHQCTKPRVRRRWNMPRITRPSLPRITWPTVAWPQLSFRPSAIGALLLACCIAIPFPALGYISDVSADSKHIMAVSTEGFAALQASTVAAFTADMDGAAENLNTALGAFSTATNIIETEHQWLQSIASVLPVLGAQVQGRQSMLAAGHHMALGNTYLVKGITTATELPDSAITARLATLESHLKSAAVQYDAALTEIASIPSSAIPKEYRAQAEQFEVLFGTFVRDMYHVLDLVDVLLILLGTDSAKSYLVMFQNHHELRPTGGFMGSYALVHVDQGTITWDIPSGGTYDVQGQLRLNYAPPLPLQVVNEKWELQDANWWSHVPASAAVIEEMYADSRGTDVDGIVFVNATVLADLLSAIGPITSPTTAEVLTADTILSYINDRKSVDHAASNEPKKVLAELVPALLTAVQEGGQDVMIRLLLTLTSALNDRSVQLYANDERVEQTLRTYGWTGEIREVDDTQDYLHVVRTNLQGQKSDANITESITLDTSFEPNGRIINTLTITRTHDGNYIGDLYEGTNMMYLRAYVPQGSTLISAEGFQFPNENAFKVPSRFSIEHPLEARLATRAVIDRTTGTYTYTEFNKTVFANWVIVPRGESRTITIKYALPFTLSMLEAATADGYIPYTMMHQKQSGLMANTVHTIRFPESWDVYWQSDASIRTGGNFAMYTSLYERDMYYGIILAEE